MLYSFMFCIAYIIGIIWGLTYNTVGLVPFVFIIICLSFLFFKNSDKKILVKTLLFFSLVIFGFIYYMFRWNYIDSKYSNSPISETGEIIKYISEGDYFKKYEVKLNSQDKHLLYLPKDIKIVDGDIVSFVGDFKKPTNTRNKGGFSYCKYLYSKGIYGNIYVYNSSNIEKIGHNDSLVRRTRSKIASTMSRLLPKEELGLLLSMIIGDKSNLDDYIQEDFKDAGISHLLAISGAHVTYVILMFSYIFNKLFGKKVSNIVSIITIIFFTVIVGNSPSILRSGIMTIILILSDLLLKKPDTISSLSVSALIILIINPISICDVGFVLSYGGTIGIVVLNKIILEKLKNATRFFRNNSIKEYFLNVLSVSISAQIILLPIMCYYFNTISLMTIFSSVIITPLFAVAIIFGILVSILGFIYFPLSKLFGFFLYFDIHIMIVITRFLANLPFSNLSIRTPSIIFLLLYYLIIYKLFFSKKASKVVDYYLNVFCVVLLLLLIIALLPKNFVEINFIDVGQGDCTHIKTSHGYNILIDGGGSESSDYDVGENILIPYLLDNTNGCIDAVFVSHFHEDHAEGIISLLEYINDNRLYSPIKIRTIFIGPQPLQTDLYKELLRLSKELNIKIVTLNKGNKYYLDGIYITALYPNKKIDIDKDLNNNSLILRLDVYSKSIIFMGDAETEEEGYLLNNYLKDLKKLNVDVLKVGHHGSKTSSTEELIKATTPDICIISCGIDNKFGHPNIETLEKLQKHDIQVFRTDKMGEIMLRVYKKGYLGARYVNFLNNS